MNYLVGWFGDDGTLIHTQTISSTGELTISSLETDHKGTVYLTGSNTQALKVGGKIFGPAEGKNTFVVTLKDNGKQIVVLKPEKDPSSHYYCSTLDQNNLLHVAGTTTAPVDSIMGPDAEKCNELFITSFINGSKQDSALILLKGIDLVPVSIKEADGKLWIAAQFKYYCVNGSDTIIAKGQNDVVMITISANLEEKTVWIIGGKANDLPLDLSVSGKQVILTGTYSDVFTAGSEKLVGNELGSDIFLITYSSDSQEQLKAISIGGVNNDFPCAAITSKAGVYLLGQFKETLESGVNSIKTQGSYDVFVARYENCKAKNAINIESKAIKDKKGVTIYLLTAADGFTSYRWDNSLGFTQKVEVKDPKSYVVEAVDQTGCTCYGQISLTKTKSATIPQDTEIPTDDGQLAEFKLYPTITEGLVHWQAGSNFPAEGATLKVYNASGQIVLEQNYPGDIGATSVQSFDLSRNITGIYMIEISGNGYSKNVKLSVK